MISILMEHYLLLCVLCLLSFGVLYNLSPSYKFLQGYNYIHFLSLLILINCFVLVLIDMPFTMIFFNNFFVKTTFESLIQLINLVLLVGVLSSTLYYNKRVGVVQFEYYIVILLSFFSLLLLISVHEFICFYFLIELQSISFYILTAFKRSDKLALEAGIKYFILSSFSSILLLLGFSFVYAYTGLTYFEDIYIFHLCNVNTSLLSLSFLLFFVAFLFKVYAVPFHFWIADVYQNALTSVTSFFAVVPLLNVYFIFYKVITTIYQPVLVNFTSLINIVIVLTLFVGTFSAIYQYHLKRLIAYSSVTNIGYFLVSLLYDDLHVLSIVSLYIIIYSINLLGLFVILTNTFDFVKKVHLDNWLQYSGLFYSNKLLVFSFIIVFFSLAGIPPFSVFFTKLLLFSELALFSDYILIFIIIVIAIITFYYYIRIIKSITYNSHSNFFLSKYSYISCVILMTVLMFNFLIGFTFFNGNIIYMLGNLLYYHLCLPIY